ncbi:MAG TPA: hypothetical protein VLB84_15030 [Bacteroidia bacterium]|jgi:hypothetical protein|nr:hypothetical protein [Bacteroidia bacterium]
MKKSSLLLFLYAFSLPVLAQTEFKLPATFAFNASYSSKQKFREPQPTGYYSNISEGVRLSLPFIQKLNIEKLNFFALLFQINGSYEHPTISNFIRQPTFIKSGSSLTALYHFKNKHTLIGTVKLAISEDHQTISNPYFRTVSTLFYTKKTTAHFSFSLGGIISSYYQGIRFFPLLGMQVKSEKNRFLILFPLCFDYKHEVSAKTIIGMRLSPKGNLNRFYTPHYSTSPLLNSESYLRVRHIDLACYFSLDLFRQLSLTIQGGGMFAGRMLINTSENTLKIPLQTGMFAGATFTYRFIKRKKEENDSALIDADDLNLYNVTVDDLMNY